MSIDGSVLVTGATGFLGGAVVRALREAGVPVVAQGRDRRACAALRADGLTVLEWDMTRPLPEPEVVKLTGVRRVVHCAALSAPFGRRAAFEAVNVTGTRHVLKVASQLEVARFVHISSPSVLFALRDQIRSVEDTPVPAPFNAYAATKASSEMLVRAARGLSPVVLRPRGLYGPGDTALLPRLLRAAQARPLPVFRGGVAQIDLTYIDDAVRAVRAALDAGHHVTGQTFHIAGPEVLPVRHLVAQSCAMAGVTPRWRKMRLRPALMFARAAETWALRRPNAPEPVATRYGLALFAFRQSLDTSCARAHLNWQPQVDFAQGLARTFDSGAP